MLAGAIVVPVDYRASGDLIASIQRVAAAKLAADAARSLARPSCLSRSGRLRRSSGARQTGTDSRLRSRATTSPKCCLPRERRPIRRASSFSTRTCSRTSCRSNARWKVQEVCQAVSSDPLSESAAAEPHVRPVDGHVHPADDRRRGRFHGGIQPARYCAPGEDSQDLGDRLRTENPGGAARVCARPRFPKLREAPRAGNALDAPLVEISACSPAVRLEVLELHRRRRAARPASSRSSGRAWGLSSFRVTG